MNSLEIFTSSPHYCYNKCMGTRKEKLYFDVRVYRVKYYSYTQKLGFITCSGQQLVLDLQQEAARIGQILSTPQQTRIKTT